MNAATAKQAESKAATEAKNMSKTGLIDNARTLARQIQARPGVPDNLKEQLGLNVADPIPSPLIPQQPTEFSATIGAGGLCSMRWNRNGNAQGTVFLIESSQNFSTGWQINATSTKTTYEMQLPFPIGQNYFRIRAQKGEVTSEPSNIAVV